MSDTPTLTAGSPYVRQVTETSKEINSDGTVTQAELPGFLELCVDVNGVPWVIARRKAPGLLADIARAAASGFTAPAVSAAGNPPIGVSPDEHAALADRVAALEAAQPPAGIDPSAPLPPDPPPAV